MMEVFTVVLEVAKLMAYHLLNYNTNFDILDQEVGKLKLATDKVRRKVEDAEINGEVVKQEVVYWLQKAYMIIDEAEYLIEVKGNSGSFIGSRPNLMTRHKLSKEAWTMGKDIALHLQRDIIFPKISDPTFPEEIFLTSTRDYEAFESRNETLKSILRALNDANVYVVRICGIGGIGKTTLAKEVDRQVRKHKFFDKVVFLEITKTTEVNKIEEMIADKLNLQFNDETERGSTLCAQSRYGDKILLILDNISDDRDLETIRSKISSAADHGGCKLLLTTRDKPITQMGCRSFEIGALNEEEARGLFRKMGGDYKIEHQDVADNVIRECKGLPVAIVTLAKALRKENTIEWGEALGTLRGPPPANITEEQKMAYGSLKLSYNSLKVEEVKKIFLLCCLLQNDASFSNLFKYVLGLNILKGELARKRLKKLVRELKDSCLLLDGHTSEHFSVHDVVRDVTLLIACSDQHVFMKKNDVLSEWPDKDSIKRFTKFSLIDSEICEPPQELEFSKLEFFHLSPKDNSFKIHDNFFMGMSKIKVLNLIRMQLKSLPSSLNLLVNLQTLCLDFGELGDVAIIGELKKLKILSLQGSSITHLPKEIGQLTKMKLLDLNNCRYLKDIAPNVISNLSQLEELHMINNSIQWEVEGLNVKKSKASLEELKHLSCLTTLEINITDDKILPKGFFSKRLGRYKIFIGDSWHVDEEDENSRMLKLKLSSGICSEDLQGISNAQVLYLKELQGVENVVYGLDRKGFSQLKHLHIEDNHQLLSIVDSSDPAPQVAFPRLESFFLSKLINLEKTCHGQFTTESFCKLKSIEVDRCDKLKKIFSFPIIRGALQHLQTISVSSCQNMEEVFSIGGEDGVDNYRVIDKIEFSQLCSVTLSHLPKLKSFFSGSLEVTEKGLTSEAPSDEIIMEDEPDIPLSLFKEQDELDIPTTLFNEQVVFAELKTLMLVEINSEKIWDSRPATTSSSYQCLKNLIVKNCQKIKSVFSVSVAKSLEQLQHLEISECSVLKEIVAREREAEPVEFVFPRVTFLRLSALPELTNFYPGMHTLDWPKLKKQEGDDHEKIIFPKPETFTLKGSDDEKILDSPPSLTMSSPYKILKNIILEKCPNLKCVFSSSIVKSLQQLQHLEIRECTALKEIVERGVEELAIKFRFPRLTIIKLSNLPNLRTFYPGIHVLELPMLKQLEMGYCDKVNVFGSKYLSFCENNEETNLDVWEPQPLFLAEKINHELEELTISGKNVKMMWQTHFLESHFSKLKFLNVKDDESKHIPLRILQSLQNLEKLILSHNLYKEIFSCRENEKHVGTLLILQNLSVLKVEDCDKLINAVPSSTISFQNLTTLEVCSCNGMVNLIKSSTAKSLKRLREMKISSCKLMIEVVAKEEHVDEIVFTELKLLSLEHLESLISFCSANYTFKFPSLKELIVHNCPKMKTFSGGVANASSLHKAVQKHRLRKDEVRSKGDLNKIIHQLQDGEVNSNSKELTLSGDSIWMAWPGGQFPEYYSRGFKVLEVIKDRSENIPLRILQGFNNLEMLILKGTSYKEIFSNEEGKIYDGTLAQIKVIKLWGLLDLKQMWQQDSQPESVLQNLEILEVKYCHKLINLAPSSASFENLKRLQVCYCYGLRNLITSSTAKSLGRLEKMIIEHCEAMTEVVEDGVIENADDEIVFKELKVLSLRHLDCLRSFCPGSYIFSFPALEQLKMENCPKMKFFSGGNLSLPRSLKLELDTTTRQLYEKMNAQSSKIDSAQPSTSRVIRKRRAILM